MTRNSDAVSSIAVFGNSHEVWPAVALLCENLPGQISLIVVEDNIEPAMTAGLTLSCENRFHKRIGITTEDLILHCNGRLGLGTECKAWQGDGSSFFLAASGKLPMINGVALHHIMLRAAHMQGQPEKLAYLLQPFRFCTRAALAGKLAFPSDTPQSPLALLGPTVQFDQASYTQLLKSRFKSTVTETHQARPVSIKKTTDKCGIVSVQIDGEHEIAADWFIDLSGELSTLFCDERNQHHPSLNQLLPFDRLISGVDEKKQPDMHGHTVARALQGGLLIETPLGKTVGHELFFSSQHLDKETTQGMVDGDSTVSSCEARFIENPWMGNLARLASASARLGPFLSADMLMLKEQLLQIVELIPAQRQMDVEAKTFNQLQKSSLEEIRDFALLPFVLNGRDDEPWASIRQADPPESLALRINQFKSRGRFVPYDNEIFDEQTWIDMMIGFGIVPQRYDPMTLSIDMKSIVPVLKNIVDDFDRTIDAMPDQDDELEKIIAGTDM